MRHGEDGEMAGAWFRCWAPEVEGEDRLAAVEVERLLRIARFDATQDVILAASPFADRTQFGAPLTLAEQDAKAEELAAACRRYLAAHEAVKAGGR